MVHWLELSSNRRLENIVFRSLRGRRRRAAGWPAGGFCSRREARWHSGDLVDSLSGGLGRAQGRPNMM